MKIVLKALACALLLAAGPVTARLTTITVNAVEPFAPGTAFGEAGAYQRVKGVFRGELDPQDPRNRVIVNLDNAPRNCSIQVGKEVTRYKGKGDDLPYVNEHATLQAAIMKGEKYNEAHRGAYSTMVAILGRMCTYSGKVITWDDAMNSKIALRPSDYTLDGTPPSVPNDKGEYPVAVPGVTKTV